MKGTKMNKTVLTMFATVIFAVTNGFAYDDPDEFEAALARASQSKPRLKAAGATLLSVTDDDNTYWATGNDLNVSKGRGEKINLQFNIPKAYTHISSATLTIYAYDVDSPSERDEVFFNNTFIAALQGSSDTWAENHFAIPVSAIHTGVNNLRVDVSVRNINWWVTIGWAKLVIDGEVEYIDLKASQNYDDRIQLKWNVSSGLYGARYYIDRRQNPDKPFKCINEDEPILGSRYDDMTASAGGNYYYRVRSESGVMSEQVTGKRVAKTLEPKFQFALMGTDRPSNITYKNRNGIVYGAKGINGEDDVLVAGHAFWCEIALTDIISSDIKYIRLIGYPAGGAVSQKRHNIICINGNDGSFFDALVHLDRDWMFGKVVPSEGNSFKFAATLKSGEGYHGKYNWSIVCEYEKNGKVGYKTVANVSKPVYFEKHGTDNGGWVDRRLYGAGPFDSEFWSIRRIPNWFAYWKADGACPSLKDNEYEVYYRGNKKAGHFCGGEANSDQTDDSRREVRLDYDAAENWGPSILKPTTINKKTFFTWDGHDGGREVFGIYMVEDIVAHETQHHKTAIRYNLQKGTKKDSDKKEGKCIFQSNTSANGTVIAECRILKPTHEICDSIVDEDEVNDFFGLKKFFGASFEGTSITNVDTYGLDKKKDWEYGAYGDNELVSMVAGRLGVRNGASGPTGMERANPYKDWAYPGELAGGIPPEASPSYRGTRMLSATPRASPKLQTSEPQSDTNLIITINSIAVDMRRDQNIVTGIVYTIGVSIQGNELVDFDGYLFDAQSNIVATAISAASAESDSVELFFDARDIFENSSGGPYILGRVELTIDGNYSTNNVLGVLYDFAVEPIELDKDELLCNKGYILDTEINEQSETGVVATVSTKINIVDAYLVSAELINTNDELVAYASVSNLCTVGTNTFRLAFSSDAIYQNGISGIYAVKNIKLWQNDALIDADATGAELSAVYDCSDFVPSNACVAVDLDSGRFIEPSMTTDGKLSSLRFVFDVTNSTDATIGYDVAAVLIGTNSALVASVNTPVYVTSGVNQIELSIPASEIAASGEDGPYRFESIELQPQGDSVCGTTYRPNMLSGVYGASDFGALAVKPYGAPRFIETSDYDKLTFEYSYETFRAGAVIAEIVLADKDGNLAANVTTTNEVSEIGVKTNVMTIALHDLSGNDAGAPYVVASLSLRPDISGEEPVYADTVSLTNILWLIAPPEFSPTTRTVFFGSSQPVVISCATPEAEIRYTLDGTEPTESSLIYDGSLVISNSVTLKARAFAEYMRPSEIVQAEYIHAAIVGGNLAQSDTLSVGVPQTLNIPAPGTYKASFDYSQGGDVELRLVGNGTTNTLAVVSAASAGSTNFLFEVAEAGKYELSIFDYSLGVAQPATMSGLNICIPDTERNRSRYWIYETEDTFGSTGEWIAEYGFVNGKMPVNGSSVFTAARQSSGRKVTILTTMEFVSFVDRDAYVDELECVKCGITLGQREDGVTSFRVLSIEDGKKVWLNVSGAGLPEPIPETPYTVKLTFDCTNRTFEVSLVERGGHETPLTYGTTNCFSYAENTDAAIYQVGYNGCGNILSLHGVDDYPEASFMQGDALSLNGSQTPAITEGEAAWLNSMNSYDVVKSKASSMSRQDIEEAYLLNLDITKEVFGLEAFKVSGVEVTEDEVKIHVWLNRTSAIQASHAGEKRDAPINGILKLYGGNTPQTKDLLNATMMTDADFANGDTATIIYPRSGSAKFFRPVIGARAE